MTIRCYIFAVSYFLAQGGSASARLISTQHSLFGRSY